MLAIALSVAVLFAVNVATPGASFILTLRHSMSFGARTGRRVAFGLTAADTVYAVMALSGVAALLKLHAGMAATVSAVGGAWLGALGLALLEANRRPAAGVAQAGEAVVMTDWRAFRIGLAAGLVNPQSVLFFSTVILASLSFEPTLMQSIGLATTVLLTSLAMRSAIATCVSHPLVRERYLARRRQFEAVSGLALLAFGMRLAVKAMYPWAVKALLLTGMAFHVI